MALAACIRDVDPDTVSVPVEVIDAEVYIEQAVQEAQASNEPLTPAQQSFQRAMVLFRMADRVEDAETNVRASLEQFVAFYHQETGRITILDRGEPMADEDAFSLMVHEMTHALQHQEGALESIKSAESWDAWLARRAVIEGEATYVDTIALARMRGIADESIDWERYFDGYQARVLERAASSTDLVRDSVSLFPYAWGGQFVQRTHRASGWSGVRSLYAEAAPSHTRTIMGGSPPADTDHHDRAVPSLDLPWARRSIDQLGAWLSLRFSERNCLFDRFYTFSADTVTTFQGDDIAGQPTTAAYWRFEFASEHEAGVFTHELDAHAPVQLGREVWVAARDRLTVEQPTVVAWQSVDQAREHDMDMMAAPIERASSRYGCSRDPALTNSLLAGD